MKLRRANSIALTLLEMMVAVTLLAVIMIGLLAMFNQTQKALHIANAQTDVFENGRGAMQMICRDLAEMTLFPDTNIFTSYVNTFPSPIPGGALPLLSGANLPVGFADAFWLARVNDDWHGIGYFVLDDPRVQTNYGVGTLYRFSTNRFARPGVSIEQVPPLFGMYRDALMINSNVVHRVSDGIVHFTLTAVYPVNTGTANDPAVSFFRDASFIFPKTHTELVSTNFPTVTNYVVVGVPAFVDVELGVLEPAALKQYQSLKNFDPPSAQRFLTNRAAQIHFLRERVPIRNFVNPYRANELPE